MTLTPLSCAVLLAAAPWFQTTGNEPALPTAAPLPSFSDVQPTAPGSLPWSDAPRPALSLEASQPAAAEPPLALPAVGGGPLIELTKMPPAVRIDRAIAFNFVSPDQNEIDGGSAGNANYTAWNFGYGNQWNNLQSEPITAAADHPAAGDGAYSINGQLWTQSLNGFGGLRPRLVNTLGALIPTLSLDITGSFSTYNTGGSPFGTASGGVPPGWDYDLSPNVGSMGLSHLWIDGRFWNDTDITVTITVNGVENGDYVVVFWLNPSNHDPLRSGLVVINNQVFRINHVEGVGYSQGNRLILAPLNVFNEPVTFDFRTFSLDGINADSSLAGFALLRLR